MQLLRLSIRPRTLVVAMAVIVAAAAAAVWLTLELGENPGRVKLADFSEESTATVGLAGVFPSEADAPLVNPIGLVTDGELLYVAESDAGRVSVYDARGGRVGAIGLPKAKDSSSVYPSSLALAGDRLAVIDNAAARVIVVSTDPAEEAAVLLTLGEDGDIAQPTGVAYADGEFFVFDAAAGVVLVYDETGELVRTIARTLQPPLEFASGMTVIGDDLLITDSNGGRVLSLDKNTGEQRLVFEDRYTLPRAVLSLGEGRLAVVDTFERAVYITDTDGGRLDAITGESVPEGPLSSPRGAAWLAEGARLYVVDAATGRVVVFNVRTER